MATLRLVTQDDAATTPDRRHEIYPSVRQVLELPAVRDGAPVVRAGEEHLDRSVRWTHVAEVADVILVVGAKMPDSEAYAIVKAIFDNMPELVRTHQEYSNVKLENQKAVATPLAFHPGALKYFGEKGVKVD